MGPVARHEIPMVETPNRSVVGIIIMVDQEQVRPKKSAN
jgi:hypothetical protein